MKGAGASFPTVRMAVHFISGPLFVLLQGEITLTVVYAACMRYTGRGACVCVLVCVSVHAKQLLSKKVEGKAIITPGALWLLLSIGWTCAVALPAERIGGRAIERVALLDGTLWIRVTGSQILFCLIVRRLLIGFFFFSVPPRLFATV